MPRPRTDAFHAILSVSLHREGSFGSPDTPEKEGPRQCGQFSAPRVATAAVKAVIRKTQVFRMPVILFGSPGCRNWARACPHLPPADRLQSCASSKCEQSEVGSSFAAANAGIRRQRLKSPECVPRFECRVKVADPSERTFVSRSGEFALAEALRCAFVMSLP